MLIALALALLVHQNPSRPLYIPPPTERFEFGAPLPSLPAVMLDNYNDGMGLAQQRARAYNLQGRILWIDGTANLDRVNSTTKIQNLVRKIADCGFNTIVFDVKPISGQVLYKSAIAPKITEWRGQHLPVEFDPLPVMVHEAHVAGLTLLVSLNSFSEGHTLLKVGPGYSQPEHQSVLYVPQPEVLVDGTLQAALSPNPNTMPKGDDLVHLFTEKSNYKNLQPGMFTVTVDADGRVVDGFEAGGKGKGVPTIPSGGYLLVASGEGADFLRKTALPGSHVEITASSSFVREAEHPDQYPLMMNPNDPEVQSRALRIVQEIVSNYNIDGLLYDDRLRYAGMNADFSPLSKSQFEEYVGEHLSWPKDVFSFTFTKELKRGIKPGRFYDAWMLWRAMQMRNWVQRVSQTVKTVRPGTLFGIYGGSWYGEYPAFGSNYGAAGLESGFWFLTPKYAKTGFANLIDVLITGCYYTVPTIYDAMTQAKPIGPTVEAAGQLTNRVADDQCWTYAGIDLETFHGDATALGNALQAACASTQGVMVFDLSHNIEPMWPLFKKAFAQPARPPHAVRGLLDSVRALRNRYRELGARERPIVIAPGSPGAGF